MIDEKNWQSLEFWWSVHHQQEGFHTPHSQTVNAKPRFPPPNCWLLPQFFRRRRHFFSQNILHLKHMFIHTTINSAFKSAAILRFLYYMGMRNQEMQFCCTLTIHGSHGSTLKHPRVFVNTSTNGAKLSHSHCGARQASGRRSVSSVCQLVLSGPCSQLMLLAS